MASFSGMTLLALGLTFGQAAALPSPVSGPIAPVGSTVGGVSKTGSSSVGTGDLYNTVGGLTGTVSGAVGSVPALLQASCDIEFQRCTVTISGEIENMLTDGGNFTGKTTIAAWMKDGHAYGSADLAGTAPLPFHIKCDPKADVCLGTLSGNVTQTFANGKQVALWGWLTPSGNCQHGTCVGSIKACGDPGYKAKRADLC